MRLDLRANRFIVKSDTGGNDVFLFKLIVLVGFIVYDDCIGVVVLYNNVVSG